MKNILLVKGKSNYDRCGVYLDGMASAMRKLGCNTCVLDGYSLASPMVYNQVLSSIKFDMVFDINGTLFDYGITKRMPPEVVYGIYLCDPPYQHSKRLKQADDRTIIFACDNKLCDYMMKFYLMVKHGQFVPLSGEAYPIQVPYEERTLDIIFTGTYNDPMKIREELMNRFQGSVLGEFVEDMMQDIISYPQFNLPECLSRVLKKYNQCVSDMEFDELIEEFSLVDWYARSFYRDKVIRTLLNAGLEIHVFGYNWEDFQSEWKERLIIHEGGTYAASKALAEAKIALNIMPWFKDAFQERLASAMLSKTVAVTDESKYTVENFENDKEIIIYSLKDIDALAERIKYLLAHPEEASKIAEYGYQKVQNHKWYHRVYDMLRKIEEDFGIVMIQDGEGKELEFDIEYPDEKTVRLDAIYELKRMADISGNDLGKLEKLSDEDIRFLLKKFERFDNQFSKRLDGVEMNRYIREYLFDLNKEYPGSAAEFFSMQCRALMGKLLLEETGFIC